MIQSTLSLAEIAAFRQSMYQVFSDCFLRPPSAEVLASFNDPEWRESACALLGREMGELCQQVVWAAEQESLLAEFSALFVVPGPQQTFPFETNYREKRIIDGASRPGPLRGYTTLQVERIYLEWQLPFDLGTDEPPDHAGVELRFMSLLVGTERLYWESGSDGCVVAVLESEADFLYRHVAEWFPEWLDCVEQRARQPFYRCLAGVLRSFLETEKATLAELLARLPRLVAG